MDCEPAVLAHCAGFGSVTRCGHGLVHVQLGQTTLTFSGARYQRFVAMLAHSAANFEMQRQSRTELGSQANGRPESESADAEYPDLLAN